MRRGAIVGALAALSCLAAASDPAERLPDPAQEARARDLFRGLRCIVCQNESIDDSQADLAGDLRRIVRGQVAQGRSDDQIRRFLVDRYGEFILLKPTFSLGNALLWLTPGLIVVLGGGFLVLETRKAARADDPLSEAEESQLRGLAATEHATLPPHNGGNKPVGRMETDG